ncbi:hypothetical protein [Labedaea rhizosphaerae]|uniref:Excreted virulence factor EspC (Type VII ESX diderm) n=1 Tax=Labedaea rhizosphaerae TaxID=598644 RepID=A0A4R6S3I3_LABRH|nr:hypothetical protein [Labedaea rhizosphaerae]TDP93853.1 hypothetical protein EV186_106247 [Labedaea rhizosphaerae]
MTGDHLQVDPDAIRLAGRSLHELADDSGTGASVADQLSQDKPMLGGSPPAEAIAARFMRLAGAGGLGGVHQELAGRLGHLGDDLHASVRTYEDHDDSAKRQFGDLA